MFYYNIKTQNYINYKGHRLEMSGNTITHKTAEEAMQSLLACYNVSVDCGEELVITEVTREWEEDA